ncbi:MAG: ATP phosphoribosyltransferase regulatory subunit [Patescibacteria group bacterium]
MKLDANPYKGTRDFYPKDSVINWSESINDKAKQNYIFSNFRRLLTLNGFSEYSTSIIEPAEAFLAKSGEELGGSQLYSFEDKGGRKIALRPELTLSIARMVANKYENLRKPLRWFSIDNNFRYERPQKGRLREFWQVEIDIIGKEASEVDLEILRLTIELFKGFNAKPEMYYVLYNHRMVLEDWVKKNNWESKKDLLFKVLDNWFKLDSKEKKDQLKEKFDDTNINKIFNTVDKIGEDWQEYLNIAHEYRELKLILDVIPKLYPEINIDFTPAIIRGQAYYTGLIFECFDVNRDNPRSLFGGGRFDDLLDLYDKKAPAIGLAPGDVSFHEFLEGWNLYPTNLDQLTKVGFVVTDPSKIQELFLIHIPKATEEGFTFDIDYDYDRAQNKRVESLNKRGCKKIEIV